MQSTLQALKALQAVDRKIFRVERELARLPKELEQRTAELRKQEQAIAAIAELTRQKRRQIKEVEDITTGQRQRLRKLENESNKAGVDAAMLAHYEHEIRGIRHTISQAEDDALAMIEECEQLEAEAAEKEAALGEERRVFEEFRANLEKELAAAKQRQQELLSKREEVASKDLPADKLNIYRRLLPIREGEALAQVVDQICQGCYVGIPKNLTVKLMRDEIVQCPSCDRILFQ